MFITKNALQNSLLEEEGTVLVVTEEATLSGKIVTELKKLIKSTSIPVFMTKEETVEWRDGAAVELCIGRRFHETTFSWWLGIEPDEWRPLDLIAKKLLEIDKAARYVPKIIQQASLSMEGKASFLLAKEEKSLLLT